MKNQRRLEDLYRYTGWPEEFERYMPQEVPEQEFGLYLNQKTNQNHLVKYKDTGAVTEQRYQETSNRRRMEWTSFQ